MADDDVRKKLKEAQIDVDHWQRLGEGMTPEQMFDQASQAIQTHPGSPTIHRYENKNYQKFEMGGIVRKGK